MVTDLVKFLGQAVPSDFLLFALHASDCESSAESFSFRLKEQKLINEQSVNYFRRVKSSITSLNIKLK